SPLLIVAPRSKCRHFLVRSPTVASPHILQTDAAILARISDGHIEGRLPTGCALCVGRHPFGEVAAVEGAHQLAADGALAILPRAAVDHDDARAPAPACLLDGAPDDEQGVCDGAAVDVDGYLAPIIQKMPGAVHGTRSVRPAQRSEEHQARADVEANGLGTGTDQAPVHIVDPANKLVLALVICIIDFDAMSLV